MPSKAERAGEVERRPLAPVVIDRRLTARAGAALLLANARYWIGVAPIVRAELGEWQRRAGAIPDPLLRQIALKNLEQEAFNAEAGTTLATLTHRSRRTPVIRAIVALQVAYDYLDGLVEQPHGDPLRNGEQLLSALVDAVSLKAEPKRDYYRHHPQRDDGGYLQALIEAVRGALAEIPTNATFAEVALDAATRCAEAQARTHAASSAGTAQLEQWARRQAAGSALSWQEFIAGALTSVMTIYALIATADTPTDRRQALQIDATYLSIAALSTILDSLVDHEQDVTKGTVGYISDYTGSQALAQRLPEIVRLAAGQAGALPHAGHHLMTLAGVVAYYTTAEGASGAYAAPIVAQIQRELRPQITPVLAVMHTWRAAKRTRRRLREGRPASAHRLAERHALQPDSRHGAGSEITPATSGTRPYESGVRAAPARHLAIITDGNGRWAQVHGLPVHAGHEAGADTLKERIYDAIELGISELTVYSFSTENWSRSEEEVKGLISMFARRIAQELPDLHQRGVRMRFIGRRHGIAPNLRAQMRMAEALTAENRQMTLFIALNYGARAEIIDAARAYSGGGEEEFRKLLYVPDMHDPDLIVRTSGERRLSNFLLWQAVEAELVFREELWPDFTRESLEECLAEFSRRRAGALTPAALECER